MSPTFRVLAFSLLTKHALARGFIWVLVNRRHRRMQRLYLLPRLWLLRRARHLIDRCSIKSSTAAATAAATITTRS